MQNNEIWKDIPEYEGRYQVSSLGRVKSLGNGNSNNSKERILKARRSRGGQGNVMLCKNAIEKRYSVSRLVAQGFHGLDISDTKTCVCHREETLINGLLYNGADNLFLGTHADNMRDMKEKGRAPRSFLGKFGKLSTTAKPVEQYSSSGEFIQEWESIKMAAKALNIDDGNIGKVLKGKGHTAGGFIWKYN